VDILWVFIQVTSAEALVQSLSVDLFFYIIITTTNIRIYWNLSEFVGISLEYPYSNGFRQIPLEFSWNILSIGIPWNLVGIPMDSNGNCSRRLPDSSCFHQILLDSIGFHWNFNGIGNQNGWGFSHLDSIRIPTFRSESAGFRRNSWGKVKTSFHL